MTKIALLSKSVFLIHHEHWDKIQIPKERSSVYVVVSCSATVNTAFKIVASQESGQPYSLKFPPLQSGRKSQCQEESSCPLQCNGHSCPPLFSSHCQFWTKEKSEYYQILQELLTIELLVDLSLAKIVHRVLVTGALEADHSISGKGKDFFCSQCRSIHLAARSEPIKHLEHYYFKADDSIVLGAVKLNPIQKWAKIRCQPGTDVNTKDTIQRTVM